MSRVLNSVEFFGEGKRAKRAQSSFLNQYQSRFSGSQLVSTEPSLLNFTVTPN